MPRFFNGQTTAAGKIFPAKILIIGAGMLHFPFLYRPCCFLGPCN